MDFCGAVRGAGELVMTADDRAHAVAAATHTLGAFLEGCRDCTSSCRAAPGPRASALFDRWLGPFGATKTRQRSCKDQRPHDARETTGNNGELRRNRRSNCARLKAAQARSAFDDGHLYRGDSGPKSDRQGGLQDGGAKHRRDHISPASHRSLSALLKSADPVAFGPTLWTDHQT
jgi:hypothetical protein